MNDPADLGMATTRVPMPDGAGDLHVRFAGPEDATPVLLLHGFPETGFGWRHQVPALLEAGYRVLVPDQRGYGRSDRPAGMTRYHLDRLVDDAVAVGKALAPHRRPHVVGHDWGAAVAFALAQERPHRLRSLTICNGPPVQVLRAAPFHDPLQVMRSWYIFLFQLPWLPERLLSQGPGLRLLEETTDTAEELDVYRKAWSDPDAWRAALHWYRAALWGAPSPQGAIVAPTLILWGDDDPALGDRLVGPALGLARDARLMRLGPGFGHWTPHRARRQVTEALLDHLAVHGGPDPYLYRLSSRADWEQASNPWSGGPLDQTDGYLHLSTAAQVPGTRARFFADVEDTVVLRVDPDRLDPHGLRWERTPHGGPFPHLYRPLPHHAVVDVLSRDP